ncbi:MAG: response regulator [Deltaproteobacteria bacterium]|nr:response regulator [Deltaproteobacteria bacterium]
MAIRTWNQRLLEGGAQADSSPESLRRVRLLNLAGLVLLAFCLVWLVSFLVHGIYWMAAVLLALWLLQLGNMIWLRRGARLTLVAHLTVALLFLATTLANWSTGGLAQANDVAFLTVPVLAIFLAGRGGLVWVLVTMLAMGTFHGLHVWGYDFPQPIPPDRVGVDFLLTWSSSLIVIAGATLVYEESRRQAADRTRRAREAAEAASRAKGQFLANMSHEFRTPLSAIIGLADLGMAEELSPQLRGRLETVKKSAYSLLSLVEDTLDIASIEAGRLPVTSALFHPQRAVEEVAYEFRERMQAKGLILRLDLSETDGLLCADAKRLRQVLFNLLDNAVKFTDQGSVTVRAGECREGRQWFCEVEDSGPGIPAAQQARIFEPFSQVDASRSRSYPGTGLGLAICRELVERMDGEIELDSRCGQGSRFTVRLPLAERRSRSADRPSRVLAVEDDPVGRELVATILRAAGYEVDLEPDGRSAVDSFESARYDLVLMDVQMPGMDGLQAVREIRALESKTGQCRVPVLALTAYAIEEERARCFDSGMDGFITKPVEPSVLLASVRQWIG